MVPARYWEAVYDGIKQGKEKFTAKSKTGKGEEAKKGRKEGRKGKEGGRRQIT
jgi:hypothetical protein